MGAARQRETDPDPPSADDLDRRHPGRGRNARKARDIPLQGWRDIFWGVLGEIRDDRAYLVAAGATFYLLLALFPALAAFVSLFGLVADSATIADRLEGVGPVLPEGGLRLIEERLTSLADQTSTALSFGFIGALLVALYSAMNGIKTLFQAAPAGGFRCLCIRSCA